MITECKKSKINQAKCSNLEGKNSSFQQNHKLGLPKICGLNKKGSPTQKNWPPSIRAQPVPASVNPTCVWISLFSFFSILCKRMWVLPRDNPSVVITWWRSCSDHGVGFSRARLPVSHYRHVSCIVDELRHQVLNGLTVHRGLKNKTYL